MNGPGSRRAVLAIVLLGVVLSTGCLRIEQEITLKDDGSGTIALEYNALEPTVGRIAEAHALAVELAETAGTPPPDPTTHPLFLFDTNALLARWEAHAPDGVELTGLEIFRRGGRRHVELEATFPSLDALAASPLFGHGQFLEHRRTDRGDHELAVRVGTEPPKDAPDLRDDDLRTVVRPFLTGFRYQLTVRTPTRVLTANTFRRTTLEATWNYDFEIDPASFVAMQTTPMIVIYDGDAGTR